MKSLLFKLEKRKQKENNLVLDGVAMLTGSLGEIMTLRERTQFVLKKKKKKSQSIVHCSSVRDRANTQLPAAAAASSYIPSLRQQQLMMEDKQRATTRIQTHPSTGSAPRRTPSQNKAQPTSLSPLYLLLARPHNEGSWCGWDHWVVPG